jgi:hypothetical protein
VSLDFDPVAHRYTLDGVDVPISVTGVLKAAGLIDFSTIPADVLARAQTRGTVVHQAVHYFNEHDLDLDAFVADFPDLAGYVQAWIRFCAQRNFEAVLCEHRVASRKYQIAGTVDCFGLLDGRAVLLDFATGDPAHCAKPLQTAAYLCLAHEWAAEDPALVSFITRHVVVRRYGVRLKADASFTLEAYADPGDLREFLTLHAAYSIVHRRRGGNRADVSQAAPRRARTYGS